MDEIKVIDLELTSDIVRFGRSTAHTNLSVKRCLYREKCRHESFEEFKVLVTLRMGLVPIKVYEEGRNKEFRSLMMRTENTTFITQSSEYSKIKARC